MEEEIIDVTLDETVLNQLGYEIYYDGEQETFLGVPKKIMCFKKDGQNVKLCSAKDRASSARKLAVASQV